MKKKEMSYRSILQVFSVSIQLKDEIISERPLNVTIGDATSPPSTVFSLPAQLPCEQTENKRVKQVYGSIKIIDAGTYETVLYNRDKQNPQVISFGDTISLLGGPKRCPDCLGFTMHINLHEADQDLEISRGYLYFEYYISDFETYYDNRFSAVIHGEHGSATVFYTLFKQAVQAKLGAAAALVITNNIISTTTATHRLYGCLSVRYAGHDYGSDFERKHYRSLVFNRPAINGIPLDRAPDLLALPLAVPMVAVPKDTSLIIQADLRISCASGSDIATLCAEADFLIPHQMGSHSQFLYGDNLNLRLEVTWSRGA